MRLALGLVSAAALLVAGAAAQADMVSGPYITGFGGYTINPDTDFTTSGGGSGEFSFKDGWLAGAAVGYDFGRARIEFEGAYHKNEFDKASGALGSVSIDGKITNISMMVNALYDFENSSIVTPYVGFGMGAAHLEVDSGNDTPSDTAFAFQGLAGAKIAVTENLSAVVDYRYFRSLKAEFDGVKFDYQQHIITAGLSYNFGTPAAPMAEPAPAPVAPAPVEAARSYMVFFDWNSVEITADAQQIIRDAASAAQTLGVTRIELTGHADRSGSARYNQKLSLKRAEAVKAVLVSLGVAPDSITTVGKGETAPLVPTPDGVREAQNRRVEIVLP
ncbi:OmpA family protein [Zavarzinia sp.]|uniref:OmpA family protein n=1 Tax=Zavarzinia sp. TaxID=2027920 RepID=UPI0035678CFA